MLVQARSWAKAARGWATRFGDGRQDSWSYIRGISQQLGFPLIRFRRGSLCWVGSAREDWVGRRSDSVGGTAREGELGFLL